MRSHFGSNLHNDDFYEMLRAQQRSSSTMSNIFVAIIKVIITVLISVATIALAVILFAFPIMWLWNYTIPHLFHSVPELDFWHAWTLGMLCGLLFKAQIEVKKSG